LVLGGEGRFKINRLKSLSRGEKIASSGPEAAGGSGHASEKTGDVCLTRLPCLDRCLLAVGTETSALRECRTDCIKSKSPAMGHGENSEQRLPQRVPAGPRWGCGLWLRLTNSGLVTGSPLRRVPLARPMAPFSWQGTLNNRTLTADVPERGVWAPKCKARLFKRPIKVLLEWIGDLLTTRGVEVCA